MVGTGVDLTGLNESQQLALQTYTSVTNQEPSAGIPLLERSQWNVQIAIAKYFDGEASDPVTEARPSLSSGPSPQQTNRRERLFTRSTASGSSVSNSGINTAPRIVPQPDDQVLYQPPFILGLLLTPFSIVSRFFTRSLGLLGYFLPFLPRLFSGFLSGSPGQIHSRQDTTGRRPLNPRDAAARFIREFEEEYGSHSLKLFENGYAQALDIAKRELKFLLVVLLSPEHDDNAGFIRETLLSSEVVSYINAPRNNMILWAGSVQDSEAYQVSNALHCTKFPFAAVIVQTAQYPATAMSVVTRITGAMPPNAFLAKLQAAVTQHSGSLARARASRAEQEASRSLREEQNSAYERSLAQDRERTRLKKEAEAAKARADLQAKQKLEAEEKKEQNLLQWKKWRALSLPEEPSTNAHDVIRISVRMPPGDRVVRRFPPGCNMEELYAFVECYDLLQNRDSHEQEKAAHPANFKHEYGFRLVSPMPRTVYDVNAAGTLKDHLGRSGNLIVEPINDDPEDEEDD